MRRVPKGPWVDAPETMSLHTLLVNGALAAVVFIVVATLVLAFLVYAQKSDTHGVTTNVTVPHPPCGIIHGKVDVYGRTTDVVTTPLDDIPPPHAPVFPNLIPFDGEGFKMYGGVVDPSLQAQPQDIRAASCMSTYDCVVRCVEMLVHSTFDMLCIVMDMWAIPTLDTDGPRINLAIALFLFAGPLVLLPCFMAYVDDRFS